MLGTIKYKPMNAIWLTLACLVAFVLLVTTCCSAPESENIKLFSISATEDGRHAGEIIAGILGFCFSGTINVPVGAGSGNGGSLSLCTPSALGYEIVASDFIDRSDFESIQTIDDLRANTNTVVSQGLTQAMVFSPIGATAAGLGIIISLIASKHGGRGINIAAAVLTAITAVCSWIAFGVNVGASAKVRSSIKDLQDVVPAGQTLSFSWGAASFLPLASALVLSVALVWWVIAGPPRPKQTETQTQMKEAAYRPSMATTDDVDVKA